MNLYHKIFTVLSLLAVLWVVLVSPPLTFKEGTIINIQKGESIKQIASELKADGVIQSEFVFLNLIIFFNLDNKIVSGDYSFQNKSNMFEVIRRISKGDYQIQAKRVTLIEGITAKEMATIFANNFYNITEDDFINEALPHEGYLFPDTYYFPENVISAEVVQKLRATFDDKISDNKELLSSPIPLKDIVIMASIIEKEATNDSMQEVSNILWNRINEGIPLQVDAGFVYERDQHTFELTLEDLKRDSPYNTYTNRGLTPTAISNPGIQALKAAAFPEETDYFYFLTGYDGNMYYAKTLKQHAENREKYLREK